jgi:hypothetical protein
MSGLCATVGLARLSPSNTVVFNYGGGTDSTGGIVLAVEAGVVPDVILWSDTGDERPLDNGMTRSEYLDLFDAWLVTHSAPKITRVQWIREDGSFRSIADDCERDRSLPSKAYGLAGCTSKWKQQPCDAWVHKYLGAGSNIERWLGYTAEDGRADKMYAERRADARSQLSLLNVGLAHSSNRRRKIDQWVWRAPMWEADLYRTDAAAAIVRAGLPPPGKSACWHCPSSKPHEVITLGRVAPELLERALLIERNADLRTVKGLGRDWSWNELVEDHRTGGPLFDRLVAPDVTCFCEDG